MDNCIKAGIIGYGYMGKFHLNRSKELNGIEVIAAFDINKDRLEEAKLENLIACETLEELLNIEQISLIIVCTPNHLHKEQSIQCLLAGKHVLCEKPATLSSAETKEILECANSTGKIFTVHQNRRWDVDFKEVEKVIKSEIIGNITTIESRVFGQRGVCFGWRADPTAGGGMLYDWGVHLIDQMLILFSGQTVEYINARLLSILTPIVDDYFELELRFHSGVCGRIVVGTFALQDLPRWFVFGDRGTLKLNDFTSNNGGIARIKGEVKGFESVLGKKNLGPSRTMAHLEPQHLEKVDFLEVEDLPLEFYKNLIDSINGKAVPYVKQEEIVRVMKVIDAAILSSKKNEIIKVSI